MARYMVGVLWVALVGCGVGVQQPPSAEQVVQRQLVEISKAFEARDVPAFKELLSPELVAQLSKQTPDVDAALAEIIGQQRTGWLRIVGDGTQPVQFARVSESPRGDVAVRIDHPEAAGKVLYFLRNDDGSLGFTASVNLRPDPAALSVAAGVESWSFHFKNYSSSMGMSFCTKENPTGTCDTFGPDCAGVHSFSPTFDGYENVTCLTGHFLSCGVSASNSGGGGCMRNGAGCWYQWIGHDFWRYADGVYGCNG